MFSVYNDLPTAHINLVRKTLVYIVKTLKLIQVLIDLLIQIFIRSGEWYSSIKCIGTSNHILECHHIH